MSSIVQAGSLKEFFRAILDEAIARHPVKVAETTEFYLVNLLSEFAAADRLFDEKTDSGKDHEPLAILYHRAQSQEREAQIRTLRRLGDVSLYKAGFFADSLCGGPVGPDYYIQMGSTSYGQVADLSWRSGFSAVYRELQEKFEALVAVLEEIAARALASSGPQGALRVYESWARTGSERLEKVLVDAGVLMPKGLPN